MATTVRISNVALCGGHLMRLSTALRIASIIIVAKAVLIGVVYWRHVDSPAKHEGGRPFSPNLVEPPAACHRRVRRGAVTGLIVG